MGGVLYVDIILFIACCFRDGVADASWVTVWMLHCQLGVYYVCGYIRWSFCLFIVLWQRSQVQVTGVCMFMWVLSSRARTWLDVPCFGEEQSQSGGGDQLPALPKMESGLHIWGQGVFDVIWAFIYSSPTTRKLCHLDHPQSIFTIIVCTFSDIHCVSHCVSHCVTYSVFFLGYRSDSY